MPRILLITSTLPWPLRRNGGGQRTALLRRALEQHGEVDVLAIGGAQLLDDTVTPQALEENGITKCIVRGRQNRRAPWYAAGPLRGMHDLLEGWRDRFRPEPAAVEWLHERQKYDVIVGRYLAASMQGGVGTDAVGETPTLLDFDDMEWQTLDAQLKHDPWPGVRGKIGSAMALHEVKRLCIESLPLFGHIWVTSDEDASLLPSEGPPHSVLPNIPYEETSAQPAEGQPNEVLFVGDLQLPSNRDGLENFLADAWLRIRRAVSGATLRIVGRGLSDDQRSRWSKIEGVDPIGYATDLRECYERASVCVVPVFYGGGTKIKVLEVLQHNRPVVTTEHAMRGYRVLNDVVWRASNVAGLAAGCIAMLQDPKSAREISERGCKAVGEHFSFARFQSVLDAAIAPVLQKRQAPAAGRYGEMRITFVLNHVNLNGGIRVIAIYAERLKKRGHTVTVIARPRPVQPLKSRIKSFVSGKGWPVNPNTLPDHFDNVDVDFRAIEMRRPILDSDVPDGDVVIATWWETADWVANLSPKKGAKVYFVQDFGAHDSQPMDKLADTWRLPMKRITISRYITDMVKQNAPGGSPICEVLNSVDSAQLNAPPRAKKRSPVVGTMYVRSHFKGTDIALKAVEIARKTLPDLVLTGFGSVVSKTDMYWPDWMNIKARVPDSEFKNIYASCDAWLFPPRKEGFGLPILEAMACRTPFIATPAGAAPELIEARGGGLLVPHEDPQAMAAAIVKICSLTDNEWKRMSDAAYETVAGYSWDDATNRFEAALKAAVAECRS